MRCNWVWALQKPKVESPRKGEFSWLVVQMVLNGKQETALVDTGCGRTLIRHAEGPRVPKIMQLKCIHGDIRK